MKLNHLNLTVTNPQETHDFLITYFGLRSMRSNQNMALLLDDDGSVISLMNPKVSKSPRCGTLPRFTLASSSRTRSRLTQFTSG